MDNEIKIGDKVLLIDDETGKPYKTGIVDRIDLARGRYGVKTETGSYACWNKQYIKKLEDGTEDNNKLRHRD